MENEVREVVQLYVTGVSTNSSELVTQAFSSDATMWGYLGEDFVKQSAVDFANNVVDKAPEPDPNYRFSIHDISIDGNVATAVLDEHAYLGSDFRNYFSLVRINGRWRIVSKVFTTK